MSSEMRELVRKWKFNLRLLGPDVARRVLESCISDVEALLARTEAGADVAVAEYQVRPRGWTEEIGWRNVSKREFDDHGSFPGYPDSGWERRKLYTHPQDARGDAELIEAVGTYEEAVRLFGRTSPSASRAYCRMTDVLAAMQAKEAK